MRVPARGRWRVIETELNVLKIVLKENGYNGQAEIGKPAEGRENAPGRREPTEDEGKAAVEAGDGEGG